MDVRDHVVDSTITHVTMEMSVTPHQMDVLAMTTMVQYHQLIVRHATHVMQMRVIHVEIPDRDPKTIALGVNSAATPESVSVSVTQQISAAQIQQTALVRTIHQRVVVLNALYLSIVANRLAAVMQARLVQMEDLVSVVTCLVVVMLVHHVPDSPVSSRSVLLVPMESVRVPVEPIMQELVLDRVIM